MLLPAATTAGESVTHMYVCQGLDLLYGRAAGGGGGDGEGVADGGLVVAHRTMHSSSNKPNLG